MSIQIPNDDSALLPVHADSWSGDSPFEVVLWVPVVDCSESRSMYILPATEYDFKEFEEFREVGMNSDQIFKEIRDRVVFLDVNVGKISFLIRIYLMATSSIRQTKLDGHLTVGLNRFYRLSRIKAWVSSLSR